MSEKTSIKQLQQKLWKTADQLWSNSDLKPSEYTMPVLGLIFLKHASVQFDQAKKELESKNTSGRRDISKEDYQARGVLFVPDQAHYSYLTKLKESDDVALAIDNAMHLIEQENENVRGVLPQDYNRIEKSVLLDLLRTFNSIPDIEGDAFGKIYEYFLGSFHKSSGEKGGEFFTPTSLVKLIVNIIEPFSGRVYDPACGSGGMFVQSAQFVSEHKKDPSRELAVYGQELSSHNVRIAKMNLAVHGLEGQVVQGNTYYADEHDSFGKFDYVMANPPFNSSGIDKEKLKNDKRFPYGLPTPDNGNYLWIQLFYSTLSKTGRAGFVMANSAGDARNSEEEIRKKLIKEGVVDVVVSVGPNFFDTVTLPCTLWFLDKGKKGTQREKQILFIDAREIFNQIDRAHREFTQEQIDFIADIVRLYRGKDAEHRDNELLVEQFPDAKYQDVKGLCKVADIEEVEKHGWSLNPGRYVGVKKKKRMNEVDFNVRLSNLRKEMSSLNEEAVILEKNIDNNLKAILNE